MKTPTALEIENRFCQEIYHCQVIMQYLNRLYSPSNHHILNISKNYFNDLYIIKIDYLTSKLIRFFDPEKSMGHDNFSIKKIHAILPTLELQDYSENKTIEILKEYRNKYLSHNDLTKSRNVLPSYFNIKKDLKIIISYLFDVLDEIRKHNGKQGTQLVRDVSVHGEDTYYNILIGGAYLDTHRQDSDVRDIVKKAKEWNSNQKDTVIARKPLG